ncbi:50S ribosomal protein L24 [Candidatus Berkelbacteria bacterium]|nr:50S ribosomal protein L24 [Candidatus Berkelbacteria bacterium]
MRYRSKIKTGDEVLVRTGKDRGKRGKVLRVLPAAIRVVVEGVNEVKRHTRPTPRHPQGGIVTLNAPIHLSNVARIDPANGKPTRAPRKRS